ncbi:hypothetical protein GLAREA_12672 [Glarea lozoyensis ATCC 20868]|uniref:Uncharacterized protein n=1 Tax=Glarea lozoyensis (strain ATCC 20868 / MF5171) TaxID=1116229 RepID=S3D2J8_GLAL2|nr:uncharacterized protein GLAREA_12672 [Glarea lozoyensis ATCC 20868]EPE31369.1 hypothetical protein GLAREA_12672 [Glarea lozoyensis ATCC 20868]
MSSLFHRKSPLEPVEPSHKLTPPPPPLTKAEEKQLDKEIEALYNSHAKLLSERFFGIAEEHLRQFPFSFNNSKMKRLQEEHKKRTLEILKEHRANENEGLVGECMYWANGELKHRMAKVYAVKGGSISGGCDF